MERSPDLAAEITQEVPRGTVAPHRFGGTEFRYGRRELGHLHGSRLADLPMPRRVRDQLVRDGRARADHVLPDSGWVSVPIDSPSDVPALIELFRVAYDRAVAQAERRDARPAAEAAA